MTQTITEPQTARAWHPKPNTHPPLPEPVATEPPCECCQHLDAGEIDSLNSDLEVLRIEVDRLNKLVARRSQQRDDALMESRTMWNVLANRTAERDQARRQVAAALKHTPSVTAAVKADLEAHQAWNRRVRKLVESLGFPAERLEEALYGTEA